MDYATSLDNKYPNLVDTMYQTESRNQKGNPKKRSMKFQREFGRKNGSNVFHKRNGMYDVITHVFEF